jgi:hypothetical protein
VFSGYLGNNFFQNNKHSGSRFTFFLKKDRIDVHKCNQPYSVCSECTANEVRMVFSWLSLDWKQWKALTYSDICLCFRPLIGIRQWGAVPVKEEVVAWVAAMAREGRARLSYQGRGFDSPGNSSRGWISIWHAWNNIATTVSRQFLTRKVIVGLQMNYFHNMGLCCDKCLHFSKTW